MVAMGRADYKNGAAQLTIPPEESRPTVLVRSGR
jgi:hypothetical protein